MDLSLMDMFALWIGRAIVVAGAGALFVFLMWLIIEYVVKTLGFTKLFLEWYWTVKLPQEA